MGTQNRASKLAVSFTKNGKLRENDDFERFKKPDNEKKEVKIY